MEINDISADSALGRLTVRVSANEFVNGKTKSYCNDIAGGAADVVCSNNRTFSTNSIIY